MMRLWVIHQKCKHVHSCHMFALWVWDGSEMLAPILVSEYFSPSAVGRTCFFPKLGLNPGDMKTIPCLHGNQEALPCSLATSGSNVGCWGAWRFLLEVSAPSFFLHQFPGYIHTRNLGLCHSQWAEAVSQREYSSGKKGSKNTPTHSRLQKCFCYHRGQGTIKNRKHEWIIIIIPAYLSPFVTPLWGITLNLSLLWNSNQS